MAWCGSVPLFLQKELDKKEEGYFLPTHVGYVVGLAVRHKLGECSLRPCFCKKAYSYQTRVGVGISTPSLRDSTSFQQERSPCESLVSNVCMYPLSQLVSTRLMEMCVINGESMFPRYTDPLLGGNDSLKKEWFFLLGNMLKVICLS